MATNENQKSPENPKHTPKESIPIESESNGETIFSPRFRSVAAMAGWDEEALLLATLIVEDTPERESKQKRRINLHFKTPPASSRRKRKAQRVNPSSIPSVVLNLDDEEKTGQAENDLKTQDLNCNEIEEKKREEQEEANAKLESSSASALPCMDRLREELSCAICLEICFEPSTTPCGHSFCKKCLKSAADKCGKRCPKCRQLIGNGRSCTVNTVLWNTIQLLFPQEVEARKTATASALKSRVAENRSPQNHGYNVRSRSARPSAVVISRDVNVRRGRRGLPSQDEDAELALRLQREEFMEVYRGTHEQLGISSISSARANLRAMASRAINIRIRSRPV